MGSDVLRFVRRVQLSEVLPGPIADKGALDTTGLRSHFIQHQPKTILAGGMKDLKPPSPLLQG
jgi:hypothetical protein